jgi:hypothetical protein
VEHPPGTQHYDVRFNQDVSRCRAVATLSGAEPPGRILVDPRRPPEGVVVRTWEENGNPAPLPFHLIVVC